MAKFNTQLWISALLVLLASVFTFASEKETYSGFALYRCTPQTQEQVDSLRELQASQHNGEIEFWKDPSSHNKMVDIMVSPEAEDHLRTRLRVSRVPFKKVMHDVGEVIRRTSKPRQASHRDGKNLTRKEDLLDPDVFYSKFQTYSLIESKLKALANSDSRIKLEEVGRSYENRPLYLVKVSSKPEAKKPVIFIDAGHHAREWASHATIIYVLESLLNNKLPTRSYSAESELSHKAAQNVSLAAALETYDFWIMPVVNPDGYEYSHKAENTRFWRKTRSRDGGCSGVDPNRNYPFKWQRSWTCGETYSGPKALSEPETQALANVLLKADQKISMYISLHAYAAMILCPYGYGRVYPENIEELNRVASAGARAIQSLRGTSYKYGTAAELLYDAAGGSDDFAYATANIKLSYTIELADRDSNGFLMQPEEIVPSGQEIALGIAAMVSAI